MFPLQLVFSPETPFNETLPSDFTEQIQLTPVLLKLQRDGGDVLHTHPPALPVRPAICARRRRVKPSSDERLNKQAGPGHNGSATQRHVAVHPPTPSRSPFIVHSYWSRAEPLHIPPECRSQEEGTWQWWWWGGGSSSDFYSPNVTTSQKGTA